jgi:hypothetical protein
MAACIIGITIEGVIGYEAVGEEALGIGVGHQDCQ